LYIHLNPLYIQPCYSFYSSQSSMYPTLFFWFTITFFVNNIGFLGLIPDQIISDFRTVFTYYNYWSRQFQSNKSAHSFLKITFRYQNNILEPYIFINFIIGKLFFPRPLRLRVLWLQHRVFLFNPRPKFDSITF